MLVQEILYTKGSAICAVPRDASMGEIVRTLADEHIGTVLVTEQDDSLAGIISERDVIKQLALRGSAVLKLCAEEVMAQDVVTCSTTTASENALELMRAHTIRHLPVIDDGVPVGIISTRDLLEAQRKYFEQDIEMWQRVGNAIELPFE
ncbi:MAG: CBS domain-containing protein [Alphaproteobacteria bacterium]|jgi:CBS domain-containing protein|nr:CBS domain-containing protein [Alphaproteobacteria bacterium]